MRLISLGDTKVFVLPNSGVIKGLQLIRLLLHQNVGGERSWVHPRLRPILHLCYVHSEEVEAG